MQTDDGKRFFEAVESWATGGGERGGGGGSAARPDLQNFASKQVKFGCLFHLSGNCSLAAFLRKHLRVTMLLRGAFCVGLACLFRCLFWVTRAWTCLGDAGDAGGAGGSASTRGGDGGDAGDAGDAGAWASHFASPFFVSATIVLSAFWLQKRRLKFRCLFWMVLALGVHWLSLWLGQPRLWSVSIGLKWPAAQLATWAFSSDLQHRAGDM